VKEAIKTGELSGDRFQKKGPVEQASMASCLILSSRGRRNSGFAWRWGAQASDLRDMVVGQGMTLTLIGVVIGIGGASGSLVFWQAFYLE